MGIEYIVLYNEFSSEEGWQQRERELSANNIMEAIHIACKNFTTLDEISGVWEKD